MRTRQKRTVLPPSGSTFSQRKPIAKGLLSEGQLARLLHLDRVELREILTSQELEGSEADEVTNFPG
jgi:hypothetical protein